MKWHAQENGSALVVALVIMTVILSLGLGVMKFADVTQRKSGDERIRETAFNLTEAVLNNQAFLLSNGWRATALPPSPLPPYPPTCKYPPEGPTDTGPHCPSTTALTQSFAGTDFRFGASWTVTVRDDLCTTTSCYYSKSTLDSTACNGILPCTWDANGNSLLWVRAQGTIAGRARTLIALVRQSQKRVAPPRSVIVAGKFTITNTGRKTVVDEKGCQAKNKPAATCNTTDPAPIVVRCTTSTPATSGDACLGYRAEQVAPNNYQTGYTSPVFDTSTLDNMRTYAKQAGSYYNGTCPGVSALSGSLVFVEGASCSYSGGAANSAASPGVLVVNQGTLSLGGNFSYYGLIYMANNLPSPQNAGNLVMLSGTSYVQGAIQVEGSGGVSAGSSGLNVSFDPNAIASIPVAGGGVALAPNSIRELPQSQ